MMDAADVMPIIYDILTNSDLVDGQDFIYRLGYDKEDASKVHITVEDVGQLTLEVYTLSLTRLA